MISDHQYNYNSYISLHIISRDTPPINRPRGCPLATGPTIIKYMKKYLICSLLFILGFIGWFLLVGALTVSILTLIVVKTLLGNGFLALTVALLIVCAELYFLLNYAIKLNTFLYNKLRAIARKYD